MVDNQDNHDESLAQRLIEAARKAGAGAADAIVLRSAALGVDIREGGLEQAERSESLDLGLRVFDGRRQAVVSASGFSDGTVSDMAMRAVAMARAAPEDPYCGLAAADQLAKGWDMAALELADPTPAPEPAQLQETALCAEAAALKVATVTQVLHASAGFETRSTHLAATNGFCGSHHSTGHSLSCSAIAGKGAGMERDHSSDIRVFRSDLRMPEEIGDEAGRRAAARLGARKPPTGSAVSVLFDERVAGSLIGHLLAAANGAAIVRGASWLQGDLGVAVLPPTLDLVENPHQPRMAGSRPFDAEGLPTTPRAIIRDGVLQGWTLDLATGRQLGMASTANAVRGVSGTPGPSNWNVALSQGTQSRADLLRDMGRGLLVTSLIGATINPITGDYSRGASGFWVEGGEIAYPVNECTIAGNLRDMLRRIVPANDARTWRNRAAPSLLVAGMTLAGA